MFQPWHERTSIAVPGNQRSEAVSFHLEGVVGRSGAERSVRAIGDGSPHAR
jgi:hypothetical protein